MRDFKTTKNSHNTNVLRYETINLNKITKLLWIFKCEITEKLR